MITYVFDELFYSPARVLVNPVNTVGTMGAWLAKDFKRFFPSMFEAYQMLCQNDQLDIGTLMLYRDTHRWILNFPVRRHYRADIQADNIEAGLKKFAAAYATHDIASVSFPALGLEQDGLDWHAEIRPLLEAYLNPLPIMAYIHLPQVHDFDQPNSNIRTIHRWLTNPHVDVPFEMFSEQISKHLTQKTSFKTLQSDQAFTVKVEESRGRVSLSVTPRGGKAIFIPETSLRDLWAYIKRAGYAMPQNFPAGLDEHGDYLVTIAAFADMVRPVRLAQHFDAPVMGLHYVPPRLPSEQVQTEIAEAQVS